MSATTVSVVIPVFNREDEIGNAIESVFKQTYDNLEIIVVDDASTDRTPLVVQEHNRSNLRFFRHDHNRGAAEARNTGIENSAGEFIAFLDSDDRWHSEKIEKQLNVFRASDDRVGLVYCGTEVTDPTLRVGGIQPALRGDVYSKQLERDWLANTPTWLVRSDVFDKVGGFNDNYVPREDYEMNLRICESYRVDFVDEVLVTVSTMGEDRLTTDVESRVNAHEKIIDEVIRPRLKQFETAERNRVLSVQYFCLGRFCQRRDHFDRARKYFKQSLEHDPLNVKTLIAAGFSGFDRDLPDWYYRLRD